MPVTAPLIFVKETGRFGGWLFGQDGFYLESENQVCSLKSLLSRASETHHPLLFPSPL